MKINTTLLRTIFEIEKSEHLKTLIYNAVNNYLSGDASESNRNFLIDLQILIKK